MVIRVLYMCGLVGVEAAATMTAIDAAPRAMWCSIATNTGGARPTCRGSLFNCHSGGGNVGSLVGAHWKLAQRHFDLA